MITHYLACDLGAESGRLMLGSIEHGKLTLQELHRFPNTPVRDGDSLQWNIPALFAEVRTGLAKAAALRIPIASVSTDSWGVDYLLYDEALEVLPPVYHYRDSRSALGAEKALAKVGWPGIFAETGIQFMHINTIYQLAAETPERLSRARQFLCIGDAFNYWLSGAARSEESLASTTQLYDPRTRTWSKRLLEALDLPVGIFPDVVPSGTVLGSLREALAEETGLSGVRVVATCSHDTGAAVAAVPASGADWAYLSSGTWSLMGVELAKPVLTDACREANFTNEIGFGGSVRLLKNIIGLWLVQECRREWARAGHEYDYATLTLLASQAPPFLSLINPADPRFISPGDMPGKIATLCREKGEPIPSSPGAFIRCALESLAMLYRRTLHHIQELGGQKINRLHILGGGSKNALLNQFSANSLQIPILAGPVEATAAGNILIQAIALGSVPSLAAARQIVHDSFAVETFHPQARSEWDAAFARFERLYPEERPK